MERCGAECRGVGRRETSQGSSHTAVSLGAGRGARPGGQLPQFVPCYVDRLLICCYNYSPTIELIVPLIGRIHSRTPTYRDVNFLCSCQETFVVIFLLLQKMTNVSSVVIMSTTCRRFKTTQKLSHSMAPFT